MLQPDGTESADLLPSASLTATEMPNANLPIHVGNAAVAFSCSIELANLCHPETLGESLPDTRTQPVAHRQSHFVTFFWRSHWLREEVSANLPNVLHHLEWQGLNNCSADCKTSENPGMFPVPGSHRAVVLNAIFPEAASREFLLHYHSDSVHQTLTNSHDITWRQKHLPVQFLVNLLL